jgi:chromosome partitioning protein
MTCRVLSRRLTAVVAAGAMIAVAAPAASAQRDDSRSGQRVQPPKELLREYPFNEGGRLRSREPGKQSAARSRERPTPARQPVADTSSGQGNSDWLPITLVLLGAAALVFVLVGPVGSRLRHRARRQRVPAARLPLPPPKPLVTGDPSPWSGPPDRGREPRPNNSYAVANQKGGVGKTTISLVLGAAAARRGKRVLLVDLDPQASATKVLGAGPEAGPTMAEVMAEPATYSLADAAAPTEWGIDIAPSGRALRAADAGVPSPDGAVLPGQLNSVGDYDLVLIDCPPNLGALTIDALTAASHVLVVTEPTFLALQSMDELLDTLAFVASNYNQSLELAGIVLNRVETTSEHKQGVAQLEHDFRDRVWEPHIPRRAVLQDAMRSRVPPQDLPTHFADEIAELFDSLAERLERSRVES